MNSSQLGNVCSEPDVGQKRCSLTVLSWSARGVYVQDSLLSAEPPSGFGGGRGGRLAGTLCGPGASLRNADG